MRSSLSTGLQSYKHSIQVMEELGDLGGEAMDRFEMTGGERADVMRLLASLVMEEKETLVVEGVMKVESETLPIPQ